MATNYPSGYDSFPDPTATTSMKALSHSGLHVDTQEAVEAIEAILGLNPSGSFNTVVEWLEALDTTGGTHLPLTGGTMSGDITFATGDGIVGSSGEFVKLVSGHVYIEPSASRRTQVYNDVGEIALQVGTAADPYVVSISPQDNADIPLQITGGFSQAGDLTQWKNFLGAIAGVRYDGRVYGQDPLLDNDFVTRSYFDVNSGSRTLEVLVTPPGGDALSVGDGQAVFAIPRSFNAHNLVHASAVLNDAATPGYTEIQIHNADLINDMLSTYLVIDEGENNSFSSATPHSINTAGDNVNQGNRLRIDVDTVGVGGKGLIVMLDFEPI